MTSKAGTIFKIKKFAMHDGPGIRTTVFLKGCPLTCWWCHNPEGQLFTPETVSYKVPAAAGEFKIRKESIGYETSAMDVVCEIEKDEIFFDESGGGATFSGGEPLSQPEFLVSLLEGCREREIHTAVDTTGFAKAEVIERILPLTDLFLFDIKFADPVLHETYTGVSNRVIIENFMRIAGMGKDLRVRFPVIPGITDTPENMTGIIKILKGAAERVDILPYHNIYDAKRERLGMEDKMRGIVQPEDGHMQSIKNRFESEGFKVKIGG